MYEKLNLDNQLTQVVIVHPNIKWGRNRDTLSTPQLRVAEAVALMDTLKGKVVATTVESLKIEDKKTFFGKGKTGELCNLMNKLKQKHQVTAVFLNTTQLQANQRQTLQKLWSLPVYDRYGIVLQIFKRHARTQEAKIQVELASLKYLRSQLSFTVEAYDLDRGHLGRAGESGQEIGRRALEYKYRQLSRKLKDIRQKRATVRLKRQRNEIPTVAVLGYTNAGKTTLIKALTGEKSMIPKDKLFATLDTTVYSGQLISGFQILYIDTIGFISDLPHDLLESFSATLEDVINADLLLHIRDISHPETEKQKASVLNVLRDLYLPRTALENMIEVHNKIDLIEDYQSNLSTDDHNAVAVSATKKENFELLSQNIENGLMKTTGKQFYKLQIPNGGQQLSWLYREANVSDLVPSKNGKSLIVKCIMSNGVYRKFCSKFGQ
ncbi:uncharacterized protein TRIADDRAFT_18641 [Trichoplax adhaerens]|uniref:Hflx-type G domain-containing protein n=1 Tax=Trichoplax adhaerens TaxID=10228 RepID=B3RKJ7_TRIAD|nr:hypothetical protein TRIADDRAFT_18641 [Trichoplax adhaerens]EDV29414.1 hypothetical protein TRIADDRAFT_18641 [Trichoplax adhaerens]|eukprot:XP_002108616.1 hypothetical protein TRIADDRAFT_18641 [Trichoplax adhaerens]